MLRVGLTGGLGSGKSTVGAMLAARGAHILQSDTIGRELMLHTNSGLRNAIVHHFGPEVLQPDQSLDRAALARLAFTEGRVEELNAIVHPAVLARQAQLIAEIAARDPHAIVVVESALIFETRHGGPNGWRSRFDCIVLVTAPEAVRIERYIERMRGTLTERRASREAHTNEARRRIARQLPDDQKARYANFVLTNNSSLAELQLQVDALWSALAVEERNTV